MSVSSTLLCSAAIGDFIAVLEGALPEPSAESSLGNIVKGGYRSAKTVVLVTATTGVQQIVTTTDGAYLLPVGTRLVLTSTAPQFSALIPSDGTPGTIVTTTQLTSTTTAFLASLTAWRTAFNA